MRIGGALQALLQRHPQIGQLGLDPGRDLGLPGAEPVQLAPGGQAQIPVAVPPQPLAVLRRRQPARAVGPYGVQHPVAHPGGGLLARQHRPGDQLRDDIEEFTGRQFRARADVFDRLQVELPGEDRQPRPQQPLPGRAQLMAPADRGAQRPVARQSAAGRAGQQSEAVVEPLEHLVHGERAQPPGGQLQRQRNAVQPLAQLGDRGLVGLPHGEGAEHGRGAVGEQGGRVGGVQRRQRHIPLTGEPERPSSGGQYPQPGGAAQQLRGQLGAGVDQVLVAVQDEQQFTVGEVLAERGAHRAAAVVGERQRLGDGVVQEVRFAQGIQFDQPHPIAEAILQDRRTLPGEP